MTEYTVTVGFCSEDIENALDEETWSELKEAGLVEDVALHVAVNVTDWLQNSQFEWLFYDEFQAVAEQLIKAYEVVN